MSGKAAKFFTWLGVSAVLAFCLVASCLMMGMVLSHGGRGEFRNLYRWADKVGGKEKGIKAPTRVNADYNLTYDEGGSGAATFAGGGFTLPLRSGFAPRPPRAAEEAKAPRFSYYISNATGSVEIRLRKDDDAEGEAGPYGEITKKALFKHATKYATALAGEPAIKAMPLRYAAPTLVEHFAADAGVDGAYAYTAEERERTGYDGEYFLILNRGYRNVVAAAVAFRPFSREKALTEGPAFLEGLTFN